VADNTGHRLLWTGSGKFSAEIQMAHLCCRLTWNSSAIVVYWKWKTHSIYIINLFSCIQEPHMAMVYACIWISMHVCMRVCVSESHTVNSIQDTLHLRTINDSVKCKNHSCLRVLTKNNDSPAICRGFSTSQFLGLLFYSIPVTLWKTLLLEANLKKHHFRYRKNPSTHTQFLSCWGKIQHSIILLLLHYIKNHQLLHAYFMFMGPCIVGYENHISNQQDASLHTVYW